ncbi:hypothetical protein M8C21_032483, partial [Ambrosia artemisiifolia]
MEMNCRLQSKEETRAKLLSKYGVIMRKRKSHGLFLFASDLPSRVSVLGVEMFLDSIIFAGCIMVAMVSIVGFVMQNQE